MLFNMGYPHTDFHELNLDWIIKKTRELDEKVNNLLGDKVQAAIDSYFKKIMPNVVYDEPNERVILSFKTIVGDGIHYYDSETKSLVVEGDEKNG